MTALPRRFRLPPLRVWIAACAIVLGACQPYRVRSQLIAAPAESGDLFRCSQLELGRAGYAIVGADRASGWLHAQKRTLGIFGVKHAEIYVTVIPDEAGGGSHMQLSDNSSAEDDADQLRAVCVP